MFGYIECDKVMATVRSSSKSTTSTKSPQSPTASTPTKNSSGSASINEGQEDIATIAKQISDHAEAIYQTWKARGLAPTEILNCHTNPSDTFGKSITQPNGRTFNKDKSPVSELLVNAPDMSNNNLEKLVSTFVNEDKARLAARKRNSPTSGGTIQHALKKFEKNDPSSPSKQTSPTSTPLNKHVPDVLIDTIDQVLPKELSSVRSISNNTSSSNSNNISKTSSSSLSLSSSSPSPQKPQTPAKPANLINHVPSWPLKNRLGTSPPTRKELSPTKEIITNTTTSLQISTTSSSSPARKSSDILDEVSREEERLINALKAGQVITNNDPKILPEVITSTLSSESSTSLLSSSSSTSGSSTLNNHTPSWKKPDVSTTSSSPNTTPATWNGIQLKPVSVATTASSSSSSTNTQIHLKTDELSHNNNLYIKLTKTRAPRTENVPHPELSASRNISMRATASSPVRPFLTRGSVAERVLIFERCPEIKGPPRNAIKEPIKLQVSSFLFYFFHSLRLFA